MIRLDAVERLLTRNGGRLCVASVCCLFLISVIGRGYRERPVRVAGGLDFSEYSDPPLLTSVTTHRSLDQNRGVNDMVSNC